MVKLYTYTARAVVFWVIRGIFTVLGTVALQQETCFRGFIVSDCGQLVSRARDCLIYCIKLNCIYVSRLRRNRWEEIRDLTQSECVRVWSTTCNGFSMADGPICSYKYCVPLQKKLFLFNAKRAIVFCVIKYIYFVLCNKRRQIERTQIVIFV